MCPLHFICEADHSQRCREDTPAFVPLLFIDQKLSHNAFQRKRTLPSKTQQAKPRLMSCSGFTTRQSEQGKLLEGKMFYLTPRVGVDKKLLKNVVNACGGT
jgi:hypothetical protein